MAVRKAIPPAAWFTLWVAVCYTAVVAVSLLFALNRIDDHARDKGLAEARALFDLNLAYRRWAAGHGGVYVPVRPGVEPNPYLSLHPERDLRTVDGRVLTLVNPATMTRAVHEILSKSGPRPLINRVTSLDPMNPQNAPDEWESQALRSFETGAREASAIVARGGEPYLRLIRPYFAERGCLSCHAVQGYEIGDVRGGLSVGVAMRPYLDAAAMERQEALASSGIIWAIGVGGIVLLGRRIRRDERRILESEWKFRTLAESSPDWEYWSRSDGTLRFISPSVQAITGYAPEEFVRDPSLLERIVHPEDLEIWRAHGSHPKDHGDMALAFRIVRSDGQVRWLSHTCGPLSLGDEPAGRRVANRDVTDLMAERRKADAQLRQAQKMEAVGQLAGGIAHDFNNVLSVIVGHASLLQEGGRASGEAAEHVAEILASSERARNLTKSLLSFSRKYSAELELRPVDTNELVRGFQKMLSRIIGEDVALRTHLADRPIVVNADPGQLEQVLLNLATNARDAMPRGGTLSIATGVVEAEEGAAVPAVAGRGPWALVTVSDTGVGMSRDVLEHVFEPFFTTKEVGKGTGLGLSIVYNIVNRHNGYVNAYSEPGHGTVFRVYLPLGSGSPVAAPSPAALPAGGSETLLLVEDEEAVRRATRLTLERAGYTVVEAPDGIEAVRTLRERPDRFALVLCDLVMPGLNGVETAESLHKIRPGLPVVFMSGYTRDIIAERGLDERTLHFVSKPLMPRELLGKLRELLDLTGKP